MKHTLTDLDTHAWQSDPPLTFKVIVEVQDLTQFQYKFAELHLI